MIDRAAISAARQRLASRPHFLRSTPLLHLPGAALGVDCAEVWLKLEHLQVGGSFKARGMLYRLLANPVPDSGVIIASGGNAGIAVAAAAQALGVRCEVFVPEVSPEAKRARLRALGAEVVVTGAALLTTNTRGGTGGALISASKYAAARTFQNGDKYDIAYRISLTV